MNSKMSFDTRLAGIVRDFEKRVDRLLRSDEQTQSEPAVKAVSSKPFVLAPITQCIAVFNVSRANRVALYSSGPLSIREYAAAIRMLEFDRDTALEGEAEEAASAIEAQRAETAETGFVEDESAVGGSRDAQGDAA